MTKENVTSENPLVLDDALVRKVMDAIWFEIGDEDTKAVRLAAQAAIRIVAERMDKGAL